MGYEVMNQEIREAFTAGERALNSLYAARDKLNSAKNWGIFDMLGGGFFTDMIKHSKIKEAAAIMETAKYNLRAFQRELRDVQQETDLKIEIGSFLSFADFFFDGIVADYLVQSKIGDAREQVENAIQGVSEIMDMLRRQENL